MSVKNSWTLIVIFLSGLFMTGCMKTVEVHEGYKEVSADNAKNEDPTKRPGIPFYVKMGACKQTTTYAVYQLEAKLIETEESSVVEQQPKGPNGKAGGPRGGNVEEKKTRVYVKTIGKDRLKDLEDFKNEIIKANRGAYCPDDLVKKFEGILPTADNDVFQKIISNTIEQTAIVDYSKKYYINNRTSIFGNSTMSAELNADGTLSKASGALTPGATEALSTLLPIKEVLSAVAGVGGLAAPKVREGAPPPSECRVKRAQFQLSVEKVGNIFEFTNVQKIEPTTTGDNAICGTRDSIPFNYKEGENAFKGKQFTVKAIESPKEEDGSNKIKISGEIALPKAAPEK